MLDPPADVIRRLLDDGGPSHASTPSPAPASIAGVEQEYAVWVGDDQVDFTDLIDRVVPSEAVAGFAFDEAARIVRSGAIWTVDAPHAEVATAPRSLRRGVASAIADDALGEREALRRRVASVAGGRLHGYSTHLNAFADGVDGWDLAEWFASRYAPTVMLLTERAGSPGLLVRPRPQRLEIGSEFLEDRADIAAATVLVLAGVIAAWRAVAPTGRGFRSAVAPLDASRFVETWQRPGLFIAPAAIAEASGGVEGLGRATPLRRLDGRLETADDRLGATWAELRPIASSFASADELRLLDGIVAGTRPVPTDRGLPCDPLIGPGPRGWAPGRAVRGMAWIDRRDLVAAGSPILRAARRGALHRSPATVTWALTVLRLDHPDRTFFIRVPREQTARFERLWAEGSLDAPLAGFAASRATGSVARLDEASPGVFDAVEPPSVAAARMEPAKGRAGRPVPPGGKGPKRRLASPPPLPLPLARYPTPVPVLRRGRPWLIPIIAIGIVVTITVLILRIPQVPGTTTGGGSPTLPGSLAIRSVGPSGSGCAVGQVCPSQSPGPSAGQSPCPVGAVCGSPGASQPIPSASASASATAIATASARATPRPTPRSTPRPTPRPTPKPDRTDPSVTRLVWTPPVIGAPLQAGSGCDPATGLGHSVVVTVRVTDPSGIAKVTLRYRLPTGTFTRPMTKSGGLFRTTLDAASDPARWRPLVGQGSYNARLSVRAEDVAGNVRTTAYVTAFQVTNC